MQSKDSSLKAVTLKGKGHKIFMEAIFEFGTHKAVSGTTKFSNAANTLPLLP
jgi:hypothetical protein